ncbi:MAG TPA: hypothetical protein VGL92_06305 [Acidimicrobiia bacterium]|jgi:hypothetical protein
MRSRRLRHQLGALDERLARIEGMLLLKDPGAARAAEAYDGLRRQILGASAERTAHLVHLAQFDAALGAGEPVGALALLAADLLAQAGLDRCDDPAQAGAFDVSPGNESGELRVVEPAYVETHTGRVVRRGRVAPVRDRAGTSRS